MNDFDGVPTDPLRHGLATAAGLAYGLLVGVVGIGLSSRTKPTGSIGRRIAMAAVGLGNLAIGTVAGYFWVIGSDSAEFLIFLLVAGVSTGGGCLFFACRPLRLTSET